MGNNQKRPEVVCLLSDAQKPVLNVHVPALQIVTTGTFHELLRTGVKNRRGIQSSLASLTWQ